MLDPQLFKVPPDVVLLGQENGMVGLMDWPTYTHQEVIDVIDLLPTHCTEDYDRVILLQKIINFINFLYEIHKISISTSPTSPIPPTQPPLKFNYFP